MKKLLLMLFGALITLPMAARDFSYTYEGNTLIYTVIDEDAKTVEVWRGNEVNGHLIIPSVVNDAGTGYSVISIGDMAFYECRGLTEVTIPNSVTSIVNGAFWGCSGLTSVTIPNSVTSIGEFAFTECRGLTEVTIPNSVTSIGGYAFSGCSNLETLYYNAENCTEFESSAFPSNIKTLYIGDNVKTFPSFAFSGCRGLTSVTIGNSVTEIGADAFSGCSGLTEVTIGNSVTSIGDRAFSGCTSLTEVTIPESVTTIGESAFSECTGLTEVTIPNSVTSIGEFAFNGCSGLIEVTIGNSVTTIGAKTFSRCSSLTSVTIGESVTSIGASAFEDCCGLTSVTIPNLVTSISERAFAYCTGLTSVTIGTSVTSIGEEAFSGCYGLTEVNTPSLDGWLKINFENEYCNPTYYAKKLLVNGTSNKRLTLPNGTTRLNDYAFVNCENLITVTVPSSLESSGTYPFEGCTYLQRIYFSDETSLLKMQYDSANSHLNDGNSAKYYIGSEVYDPETITIPESLTSIPDYAFANWETLKGIVMHDNIVSIGKSAFTRCYGLTSVTIPNSVTSIGEEAFLGCYNLNEVRIDNVNDWARIKFGDADANPLYSGQNLYVGKGTAPIKHLVITGEDAISDFAFEGASCLETVRIKDGAPVGAQAFEECTNLTDVCLTTASLGNMAFGYDTNIKNVYVTVETPPTAPDNSFSDYEGVNLYVPAGCISAYENAESCWGNFLDIFESNFSDIDSIFAPDYDDEGSGIEDPECDSDNSQGFIQPNDIYNLQGTCLKRNATEEDVKALAPGLYIIGGKKVMVK